MRSLRDEQKREVTERFQVLRRWLTVGGAEAGETERAYVAFAEACGDAWKPLVERYREAGSLDAVLEWAVEVEMALRAQIEPEFWGAAARRELTKGQMLDPNQDL